MGKGIITICHKNRCLTKIILGPKYNLNRHAKTWNKMNSPRKPEQPMKERMHTNTESKCTLIISTFMRPDALDRVLTSVANQTMAPSEVIIADDGSDSETSQLIKSWGFSLPIIHSWIPNTGFRAARARNCAVLKASSPYLVFIDGDCVLPPDFIQSHLSLKNPGKIIAGGRALLSKGVSDQILSRANSGSEHLFSGYKFMKLPLGKLRDLRPKNWSSVRTCNLGIYRTDALSVCGFDENFIGWGREDSDFVLRLLSAGIRIRSGRLAACVHHLWHPESPRGRLSNNDKLLEQTMIDNNSTAKKSSLEHT